jgi:hypothetical protein
MLLSVAVALLTGAAAFSPPTVPAQGEQESLLDLTEPAMVRINAEGTAGTSCVLVDQRRGPFARAGVTGKENCALELLLDPGQYKLRLRSPKPAKGKAAGEVKLVARVFEERSEQPRALQRGVPVAQELHAGQQASFWLHRDTPGPVLLRVLGRTAGQVELWHDGQWRAAHSGEDLRSRPRPDRPIHEWVLQETLPAGDTRLTVYGTGALRWGTGEESDRMVVLLGAPPLALGSTVETEVPWSGLLAYEVPGSGPPGEQRGRTGTAALLLAPGELDAQPLALELQELRDDGSVARNDGGCQIAGVAPAAQGVASRPARSSRCFARGSSDQRHLALLRGKPGTRVRLELSAWRDGVLKDGEAFGAGDQSVIFRVPAAGSYLVGLRDLPATSDEAPLSCALAREAGKEGSWQWEVFARSYLPISSREPFERSFNRDGGPVDIWFELGDWGLYTIETKGALGTRCLLMGEEQGPDKGEKLLNTSADGATDCKLSGMLTAGRYQLRMNAGHGGIETVRISSLTSPAQPSATRSTCLVRADLAPGVRYRLVTSRRSKAEARQLIARPLPLALERGALLLDLDPGAAQRLPVAGAGPVVVTGPESAEFACGTSSTTAVPATPAQAGRCTATLKPGDELILYGRGALPAQLSVARPAPAPVEAPAVLASPKPVRLPELVAGRPFPLDLEPGAGRTKTLTFTVAEGGLWQLTTQGLLATSCALRTPAVVALTSDEGSGRGRNCLVSGVLSPGRYAATVSARGSSRGRAYALLVRQPAQDAPALSPGADAFFRAPEGQLITQRVLVPAAGVYRLSASALGARLSCRLEDAQGWPLREAPSDCSREEVLPQGELRLSQLPLTVESQRHAQLAKVRPPVLLQGEKAHRLAINQYYQARLGKRGFDLLKFKLEARLPIDVLLTGGMQGRLYRGAEKTPIEVIAPQGGGSDSGGDGEGDGDAIEQASTDDAGEPPSETPAPEESSPDGDAQAPDAEPACEGEECPTAPVRAQPERAPRPQRVPRRSREQTGPQRLVLAPGDYTLRTQHSRADVAVSYQVALTTQAIAPGLATEVEVPSQGELRLPLVVPRAGTLRLRTEGDSDVRCRLFSATGARLAASDDDGADWNCAITGPFAAGDYTLSIESETRTAGHTKVVAALAPDKDLGVLAAGPVQLGPEVLSGLFPAGDRNTVQELHATGQDPFGCSLEDAAGVQLMRAEETRDCALLARGGAPLRLRLWNRGQRQALQIALLARPVGGAGALSDAGKAALATVPRAGRYATAEGLYCLSAKPEETAQLLRPCGPQSALEEGPVLFAPLGPAATARLDLREQVAELDAEQVSTWALSSQPLLARQKADGDRLLLFDLRAPPGSRTQPVCAFTADGHASARRLDAEGCAASAGLAEQALARAASASGVPGPATATLRAIELGRSQGALEPGRTSLSLKGPAGRFALPAGPARLELLLASGAWAVLLDREGGAVDLCAGVSSLKEGSLARCTLLDPGSDRAGQLAVWSPREPRVEVTLSLLPAAPQLAALQAGGLREVRPLAPGVEAVLLKPEPATRSFTAQGATRCLLERTSGAREEGCAGTLAAGEGAVLRLFHEGRPLRVGVHAPGAAESVFAGQANAAATGSLDVLEPGRAVALSGSAPIERRLELTRELVLHLRAKGAVCALRSEAGAVLALDGLGAGCSIDRLLSPGRYRITARPFAAQTLEGDLLASIDEVLAAGEGVGDEQFIGPGEARLLRFTTLSEGEVGLGLQAAADALFCTVLDQDQKALGTGCQQLLRLPQGRFLLQIRSPEGAPPLRVRPVLLGLSGANRGVPDDVLRELLSRVGELP